MTLTYVLMQNLKRNPLRAFLTGVAFALPMAIFVAAISLVVAMIQIGEASAQELRLAVHHKTTIINLLPEGMRPKIEALDPDRKRLRAVCGMRWFGGRVPNTQSVVQSLAADADTFPIVYADAGLTTPEEIEAWMKDRQACVIGKGVAETHGWNVGSRLTLRSSVPPYLELEFHVVKIMPAEAQTNTLYFRRDFLVESFKAAGQESPLCNIFWVKCHSADDIRSLQREVDALFANSPNETRSEDELAFAASFAQASGDLPGLMRAMAIVVVLIIALVAGNTMMMSFRERTRELAVFKAIGFPNGRIVSIVLGESVLLALVGALAGIVPAVVVLRLFPVRRLGFLPISVLEVSPAAVIISLIIALIVGALAGFWPALQALRLRTVNALRRA